MQSAKDSFYMTLRQRLAAANSARVVVLDGKQQPAILVTENHQATAAKLPADCFCLNFGEMRVATGFERAPKPLMALECTIEYATRGTSCDGGDRGRVLGTLDAEFLEICAPPSTPKTDYTRQPPRVLSSNVFWLHPQFQAVTDEHGTLRRMATLTLYFVPEVDA